MNVEPPPVLELVKGSAAHAAPPELAPDTIVRVGREHEPVRRRDMMAPDEAKQYTLLWDAAATRSRSNGRSVEWNWLRLMDRFWEGELSPQGLVYFFPGNPGLEYAIFERMGLASLLLGRRTDGTVSVETLCNWSVADYLGQPDPFCDYFRRDPEGRVGFAARTDELIRRREGPIQGTGMSVEAGKSGAKLPMPIIKRGGYIGDLERFIARIRPAEFDKMSNHAVRISFENECQNSKAAGKAVPSLPHDRRNIERQVEKIRKRMLTAAPKR